MKIAPMNSPPAMTWYKGCWPSRAVSTSTVPIKATGVCQEITLR